MKKVAGYVVSLLLLFAVWGCANYYKIVDPVSKSVYYTQSIDKRETASSSLKIRFRKIR